jgi:hypothetical protein
MKLHESVAIALLWTLLAGCASHHGASNATPPDQVAAPVDSLTLEVDNRNWSDVVVSVVHDGVTSRVTEVTAGAGKSLILPPRLIGQDGFFRLAVRGIGATDRYVSEAISIRTGTTIRLTVESRVARSSVGVW